MCVPIIALSDGAGLDPDLLQALRKHRLGQRGSFLEQLSARRAVRVLFGS